MNVAWVIPTVGAFGAVREMVEVSNVWVRRGHNVTIYHPDGAPVRWLPSLAKTAKLDDLARAKVDVLIGIVDWNPRLFAYFNQARATIKALCVMGFEPSEAIADALRGEVVATDPAWQMTRQAIEQGMLILADSSWQTEWLRHKVGIEPGPPFGGINLEMFAPPSPLSPSLHHPPRVIASGDPRPRKRSDVVWEAVEKVQAHVEVTFDTYWGRRFTQAQLVSFLQNGDVFLDGHQRAGWCNPVIEAMACGCAVVCSAIGAVSDFVIHEETALVVPVGDAWGMADAAMRLLGDDELRRRLVTNGLARVRQFAYPQVAVTLETALLARLQEVAHVAR